MPSAMDELTIQVQEVVLSKLAEILARPMDTIALDHSLDDDLHLDPDDFGLWLVPNVQKFLGVRVPNKEWRKISTVRQTCELLVTYCRRARDSQSDDERRG